MNVLVTGATGFLGSHLCRRLVADGYNVTILRRSTSNADILADLPVKQIIGDITDKKTVENAIAGNEIVFHAAAHLAYWKQHKEIQNQININGTQNVVDACLKTGVKKLIFISSVAAVGIPEGNESPANENFPFNLENLSLNYHKSKKRAEEIVLKSVEAGLDAVIVNPSSIWGRFGNKFRGAEVAQKVLYGHRFIPVFTGGICIVHVEDVVEGIMAAVKHGKAGERYILGGENLTLKKIAELVARQENLNRSFVSVPKVVTWLAAATLESAALISRRRPKITFMTHYGASRFHYYDSSKARRELNFAPRSFQKILDECLAFIESQNGNSKTN